MRFGVVLLIQIKTVKDITYLAIHPQEDIPFAYYNTRCSLNLNFYVVLEGIPSMDYIYKGFWCYTGTKISKGLKETILDLVWEDEDTPVQPVTSVGSMGSPFHMNQPQTLLAVSKVQKSSSSAASGNPQNLLNVWQMSHDDTSISQLSPGTPSAKCSQE